MSVHSQSPMIHSEKNTITIPDYLEIPSSFAPRKIKAQKPRSRAVDWLAKMITVLVHELVQAIMSGKKSDNGFKIEVWNSVSEAVRYITGYDVPLTGAKCQAKLEGLKKKWKIWIRLKEMSRFGINPLSGSITAPEKV